MKTIINKEQILKVMLKKQILFFTAIFFLSVSVFSQKSELKAADKAIKKEDYAAALSALNQAEGLIANAEAEAKAKYYYLKGMALYEGGNKPENIDAVAEALNKLITIENESGDDTYTNEAGTLLNGLISNVADDAHKEYTSAQAMNDSAGFIKAAKSYERVYLLSPTDTSYLYNAALVLSLAKDYENSNERYMRLLDMGYTGIATTYKATSEIDGSEMYFNSQKDMDRKVKLGMAIDPKIEVSKSRTNTMVKAIATNYSKLENNEKALEFIAIAKEKNPNDYDLVIEEANIYYRMENNEMFKEKLEEAIKLNPTDPVLYFNVGVMNMTLGNTEGAVKSFNKAIELNPEFGDAYNNLGSITLDKKDPILEEMNANASNFAKYDKIKDEELLPVYKEALGYYEKAYEFSPDEHLRNLINSLYENLDMDKHID